MARIQGRTSRRAHQNPVSQPFGPFWIPAVEKLEIRFRFAVEIQVGEEYVETDMCQGEELVERGPRIPDEEHKAWPDSLEKR